MEIIKVNDLTFQEHESQTDQFIVTFSASWCGKCRMLKPRLRQLARTHESIQFLEIGVEDSPELRERFGIEHVPTTISLQKGKLISRTHHIDKAALQELTASLLDTIEN